jgi:TonB-dependent starch-binding outer membrane protein SusC
MSDFFSANLYYFISMKQVSKLLRASSWVGLWVALFATCSFAQDRRVTGRVTADGTGEAVVGVSVVIKGTSTGTTTDANGQYSLNVRGGNDVLVFSFIGFKPIERAVGSQAVLNVLMEEDQAMLNEVIVTGYTSEKKKDILGAVAVVDAKSTVQQPAANISNMLQGRAAGITVSGTGAPGAGAKVRIRGFTSFGNSDPLYVIDGVQTYDPGNLNPQDVESIQVLKDPASASIYGSRAANGVIVVTTRQGGNRKTEISYDGYYGIQTWPQNTIPRMINTQQYGDMLWRLFQGAGITSQQTRIFGTFTPGSQPRIPDFLVGGRGSGTSAGGWPAGAPQVNENLYFVDPVLYASNPAANDRTYQIARTSPGTDWFREIYQVAPMQMHQVSANGGSDRGSFALGFNYLNQDGNYIHTNYQRYTARANSQFKLGKNFRIGQNLQLAYTQTKGGTGSLDFNGEGSPWAQAYRMVPYIPVYDIRGNFAGNGPGESGNGSNPVANLIRGKDNRGINFNILGNVYAQADFLKNFTFTTTFNVNANWFNRFNFTPITFERSENQLNNTFGEGFTNSLDWQWSNVLQYRKTIAEKHSINVFGGTEAVREGIGRFMGVDRDNYDFNDPAFWSVNTGRGIPRAFGSPFTPRALFSVFGRAEYSFDNRYLINATVRRDGSSAFGEQSRFGTFPAVGVGWRVSEEAFMKSIPWITELKLRGSWGQMGSQRNVSPINQFDTFGIPLRGAYDITGANGGVAFGYRPTRLGNVATSWETAEMVNIGLDATLLSGKVDFTVEYFNNNTSGLLIERLPNLLEPSAAQPTVNVGRMLNRGIDIMASTRGSITNDLKFDVGVTFSHFINRAVQIDGEGTGFFERGAGRLNGVLRTEAGRPISSQYGFIIDGIFQTAEEARSAPTQPNQTVGAWRLRDINGRGADGRLTGQPDGRINDDDRTFIGSPIPKFTMGYDIVLRYKAFDFNTFLFWNYGNDIFNYTKWWTDLRGFVGGVSERVLTNSWTPQNPGATLPILNQNDTFSGSISNRLVAKLITS